MRNTLSQTWYSTFLWLGKPFINNWRQISASTSILTAGPVIMNFLYQKHITPKRLTSHYLFRTMLGYFCRRSRPIRSTEIVLAKYGIREIKAKNFELVTLRFELSRVRVSQGKITVNVWRKSRGIRFLFELALASSYTESTVLWSHLRFLASRVLFSSSDTNESADSSLQSFYKTYLHNGAGQVCIAVHDTWRRYSTGYGVK